MTSVRSVATFERSTLLEAGQLFGWSKKRADTKTAKPNGDLTEQDDARLYLCVDEEFQSLRKSVGAQFENMPNINQREIDLFVAVCMVTWAMMIPNKSSLFRTNEVERTVVVAYQYLYEQPVASASNPDTTGATDEMAERLSYWHPAIMLALADEVRQPDEIAPIQELLEVAVGGVKPDWQSQVLGNALETRIRMSAKRIWSLYE